MKSEIVKEIFSRMPPEILYHYTTQDGLLGIIKNWEIWASHTQYLNDAMEFHLAIRLMRREVESLKNETTMPVAKPFLRTWINASRMASNPRTCVSCLFPKMAIPSLNDGRIQNRRRGTRSVLLAIIWETLPV